MPEINAHFYGIPIGTSCLLALYHFNDPTGYNIFNKGGDPCDMSAGDPIGFVEDPDLEEVIFSLILIQLWQIRIQKLDHFSKDKWYRSYKQLLIVTASYSLALHCIQECGSKSFMTWILIQVL